MSSVDYDVLSKFLDEDKLSLDYHKVCNSLERVDEDEALDIILKTQGLAMRKMGSVLLIAPSDEVAAREKDDLASQKEIEELEPLQTVLLQLNYAKAPDVANLLKDQTSSLLSSRGNVTVDARTNAILVQDTLDKLNEVRDLNSNELVVHSNPGHTKGSSSFEFPSLGIVFTGDFIFKDGIGRTDLLTGDINEMIYSINNVFTEFHDDYILYPGHGDKDTVKSIKNNNILVREYLND